MPTLYVVATPIGNLEDMTFRAVRILKEVPLIASEDTRTTRHLLSRYEIKTPLTSYFEHNKKAKLDYLLSKLDAGDLALVSEAGMPGISDPGYELVVAAQQRGILGVPIHGASARHWLFPACPPTPATISVFCRARRATASGCWSPWRRNA
jgi:16S rRNA (cytidine1402-2'-O)-methyltransferase